MDPIRWQRIYDIFQDATARRRRAPATGLGGPSWLAVLGHAKDSLGVLICFGANRPILRTHWVLVVMDQCTRRIVGFGVHRSVVDGVALCQMFPRTGEDSVPASVSKYRWRPHCRGLYQTPIAA